MTPPLPPVVSAGALTDVLRRTGVLGAGCVRDVTVESVRPTVLSRIIRLRLAYTDAPETAPGSLILKTGLPGSAGALWDSGAKETAFYQTVAPLMPAGSVLHCFDAAAEGEAWHLLLEDLTETHATPTVWPLPPSAAACGLIVEARARCHAAWWDDPRLGSAIGVRPDAEAAARLDVFVDRFGRFVDQFGSQLPAARRALYERLFAAAPRLSAPLGQPGLTIVAMRMSGTACCGATAAATCGCSIGIAGASTSAPTTSPT